VAICDGMDVLGLKFSAIFILVVNLFFYDFSSLCSEDDINTVTRDSSLMKQEFGLVHS
jgi:hypothetical protein